MPYKDDLGAAHHRIHTLEQELAAQPEPEEEKVEKCGQCGGFLAEVVFPAILSLGILVGIGVLFVHCGDRGDCYIEEGWSSDSPFDLVQEVTFGTDDTIGSFKTMDEALDAARKIKCSINGSVP